MKKLVVMQAFCFVLFSVHFYAQPADNKNHYLKKELVNKIEKNNILRTLTYLESLETRYLATPQIQKSRDWIVDQFKSFGYKDINLHEFEFSGHQLQNIVVTKKGTHFPDTYVILGGHYDSSNNTEYPLSLKKAPGVNDNGSGIAVILEAARLLANVETKYSIKFICFSAEERGLVGSRKYVQDVVLPQNLDILLVFNIDQVGGVAGMTNNTITCERDEDDSPADNNARSAAYTDTLSAVTEKYTNLKTKIYKAYNSDYMPFSRSGYTITGYYETNESKVPHTENDTLENMDPDYVVQVARGALASMMHFSKAWK